MPNLPIGGKNTKLPQPIIVIRKKRKQTTDENIYIGPTGTTDEPILKSKWIKAKRVNKENNTPGTTDEPTKIKSDEPIMIKLRRRKKEHKDDGRSNKSNKTSTFPVLNEVTQKRCCFYQFSSNCNRIPSYCFRSRTTNHRKSGIYSNDSKNFHRGEF